MLRKIMVIACLLAFTGSQVLAANLSNVGYIEVQKVFQGYKETKKAQEQLQKQEKDFKKKFEESQEKLQQAEKDGKSKEEIEKIREKLEKDLEPKRNELLKLNEQLTTSLQQKIVNAVSKVAKKVGIETVLDKQVIIIGGMDLTDMVIAELNK